MPKAEFQEVLEQRSRSNDDGLAWLASEEGKHAQQDFDNQELRAETRAGDFGYKGSGTVAAFAKQMFAIRKTMADQNREDEELSDKFKGLLDFREGWSFRAAKAFYNWPLIGRWAKKKVDEEIENNPASLETIINTRFTILDDRIKTITKYEKSMLQESKKLLGHIKFTRQEFDKLTVKKEAYDKQLVEVRSLYDAAIAEHEDITAKYNAQQARLEAGEVIPEADLIREITKKEAEKKEQDLKLKKNRIEHVVRQINIEKVGAANAEAASFVVLEQLDTAYEQMSLVKTALSTEAKYNRNVVLAQVAVAVATEASLSTLESYRQYQMACNEMLQTINIGLQANMEQIISSVGKPFYDKENMMQAADGVKKAQELLHRYDAVMETLGSGAAQEYDGVKQKLRDIQKDLNKSFKMPKEDTVEDYLSQIGGGTGPQ